MDRIKGAHLLGKRASFIEQIGSERHLIQFNENGARQLHGCLAILEDRTDNLDPGSQLVARTMHCGS